MSLDQKGLKKRSVTVAYFFENIGRTHDIKLRRLNSVDEQKRRIFERDLHRPVLRFRALPISLPTNGYRFSVILRPGF